MLNVSNANPTNPILPRMAVRLRYFRVEHQQTLAFLAKAYCQRVTKCVLTAYKDTIPPGGTNAVCSKCPTDAP